MGKKIIMVAILYLATFSIQAQQPDVLHYRFDLALSDHHDTITGAATITFIHSGGREAGFDLAGDSRQPGRNMTVLSAGLGTTLEGAGGSGTFTHEKNRLTVTANRDYKAGDTLMALVRYKGIPLDGLIISKNKYGHRSFFADNWPNRGHNWLPCHDHPADKATTEFIVTAPAHYQVVSNGVQVEETSLPGAMKRTHWKEEVPLSTKVMVIGVADFAVQLSGTVNNCIPVYSWVYPEDRDKGFYDYAQAATILPFFIKQVGPYAYKKLANVQSKTIFGGLENANTIFYAETSVTGTRKTESLLAHEIAHQWFGNMATEKSFAHLWLSEGFATYMTILYMQHAYGSDTARYMLAEDAAQVIGFSQRNNRPVVDSTSDYMELLNPNSYQKGGWVLRMLHMQLGDELFWKGIREYYAAYAGSVADTDDLRRVFEKVSGRNLEVFFRQWLYRPGIPKLNVKWKYVAATKQVEIKVIQEQAGGLFRLPLTVGITGKDGKTSIKKIDIADISTTTKISVAEPPASVVLNPDLSVLADMKLEEEK